MLTTPPETGLDFTLLTRPVRYSDLRRYRRRLEPARTRRLWPALAGAVGTAGVIVFVAVDLAGGAFWLIPWYIAGLTAAFALAGALILRATSRRWRMRYRLEGFVSANGLVLDHDVSPPGSEWSLDDAGAEPSLVVRVTGRDRLGVVAVAIRAQTEPTQAGASRVKESVRLIVHREGRDGRAGSPRTAPSIVDQGVVDDVAFRYRDAGSQVLVVLDDPLALDDPRTWRTFGAIRQHFA